MAIRTITFSATANGVTPAQQYAGVEGEHNATNVVINLSDDLVAALGEEGTVYRFEIVDGLDRYDTSDNAVLAAGATSVNIDIPNGWTARGVAELRLVIAKLDAEGNNEMVLYSLPCRISFSERGTGTGATPETVEKGLSGLIADAKTATESANSAASSAINAGDYAIVRADIAEAKGNYAKLQGNYAKLQGDYAKLQGDYAKLQGDYAKEKGDYASNAAADVNTAISNATSATNAANIAASSADAAASAANTAADAANAAADAANTAADAANTAADAANTAADAAVAVGKKTPGGGEIFNSYTGSDANRATAPYSHAEGSDTTASGYASHAEGSDTTASGHVSHAEGSGTTASGNFSHAGGYYTIASAEAQTAIGKYNAEDTSALFIVGNGTSSSRSNAFTVKLDGSATVQTQGTSNNSVIIKSTLDTALAGKQSTSITDAGGYFTADTVEGALQEIGAQLSGLDEAVDTIDEQLDAKADKSALSETNLRVAEIGKDLSDYKAVLSQLNPNQEAKQKVSGYGIISLPKNAANGQISVTLKGNTYTNFIKNGNFANGINNWGTQDDSSVLSASNNTLIVTGTGNLTSVICHQRFNANILQTGHKYYVRAMVRVTNSNCTNIILNFRSSLLQEVASQPSPVQNQWYTLSGIITALGTFHMPYVRVMCIYPDAATAAGKVTEVREVIAIDLTVHGLDSLTVDQCNQRFAHWFDGTKSTLNARLVSVGKNLFDKNKIITGYVITSSGSQYRVLENFAVTPFIKVTPNTQYYYNQGYSSETTRRAYYTSNKKLISTESPESGVFLTPPNTSYVRTSLKLDVINIDTYQIEPGTTATEYEPYKESIAYINGAGELRSLPNGTKDEIRVVDKKLICRIGAKTNVASGTVIDYSDMTTGGQFVAYASDGTSQVGVKGDTLTITATTLIYQLATPIEIPIQTSGSLVSYPSGTVYIEPYVADAGIYTDKMEVLYSDLPIKALEKLSKIDFMTGLETELDVSDAVIAEDKLSFTHPESTEGDIVFFVYEDDKEGTTVEAEIEFYDSRFVVKDDVTEKFYKWHIAVANGVPSKAAGGGVINA